jgi:hypothetical protein
MSLNIKRRLNRRFVCSQDRIQSAQVGAVLIRTLAKRLPGADNRGWLTVTPFLDQLSHYSRPDIGSEASILLEPQRLSGSGPNGFRCLTNFRAWVYSKVDK